MVRNDASQGTGRDVLRIISPINRPLRQIIMRLRHLSCLLNLSKKLILFLVHDDEFSEPAVEETFAGGFLDIEFEFD